MSSTDAVIVAVYIALVTVLGARAGAGAQGLKGYFLGESSVPTWAVMISIVATETSTATFLSVPGVAYRGDCTYLQLALGYILGRILVANLLLPAYFQGSILTAYELLQKRFGGAARLGASLLFLAARSLGDGLRLFLAATVLEQITGWSLEIAVAALAAVTVVYTFLGGLKAVVWTDVVQFSVYLLGALAALILLQRDLPGGWSTLLHQAQAAGKLKLVDFRPDLTRPFTFWAGLLGGMVLNTATHGVDQIMVQRYLSARSLRAARLALVASGFVVLLQFAFFLFIGVSLWVFYQHFPPADALEHDEEFTYFIIHRLPTGVRGILIAAVFSAAMGSLAGSLSAASATIVNDVVRLGAPWLQPAALMAVSRAAVVLWGVLLSGVAMAASQVNDNVVNSVLAVASLVSGILLGVFLLGLFTRRVGQGAALGGMLAGAAAVSYVRFATPLAWPYFALVGSAAVVATALLLSGLSRLGLPLLTPAPGPSGITPHRPADEQSASS